MAKKSTNKHEQFDKKARERAKRANQVFKDKNTSENMHADFDKKARERAKRANEVLKEKKFTRSDDVLASGSAARYTQLQKAQAKSDAERKRIEREYQKAERAKEKAERESRKKQRGLARKGKHHEKLVEDLKKQAAKEEREKIKAAENMNKDKADDINATLSYIQSNDSLNSNTRLSALIELALQKELGTADVDLTKGDHGLYTIDDSWSGNFNTLISHITFNDEFKNPEARQALSQIVTSEWGDEKLHQKHIDEARAQAYAKNVENLDIKDMPAYLYNVLEDIMNSSDVWEIVANKHGLGDYEAYTHYESEQAKNEWDDLHRDMQKLFRNKYTTKQDISEIRKLIDEDITEGEKNTGKGYDKLRDKIEEILSRYK